MGELKMAELPSLQKEIIINLAEKGPMTKHEISKTLGKSYKNVIFATNSLIKKHLIKETKPKDYRGQKFKKYWLSHKGIFAAIHYKANREALKKNIQEIYGSDAVEDYQAWADLVEANLPQEFISSFLQTIILGKKVTISDISNWTKIIADVDNIEAFAEALVKYPRIKTKIEEATKIILQKVNELFPKEDEPEDKPVKP